MAITISPSATKFVGALKVSKRSVCERLQAEGLLPKDDEEFKTCAIGSAVLKRDGMTDEEVYDTLRRHYRAKKYEQRNWALWGAAIGAAILGGAWIASRRR